MNRDQAEFWNRQISWVDEQDAMDALLAPVLARTLDVAALQPGERVLDIGCGTGASLLAAAEAVGPTGHVIGVDIAPNLLDIARQRASASNVVVEVADAQTARFKPDCDVVLSRFGVMFFEDTTAAFRNIATALTPGGRFAMAAWGPVSGNPFFLTAALAAREVLGPMPKTDRNLPGPLAFEDASRVERLLTAAGLTDLEISTERCFLKPNGTLDDFVSLCLAIGPAASAMRHFEVTEPDRLRALRENLTAHFAVHDTADGLKIPALLNMITARI